jgi:hypothetical protein
MPDFANVHLLYTATSSSGHRQFGEHNLCASDTIGGGLCQVSAALQKSKQANKRQQRKPPGRNPTHFPEAAQSRAGDSLSQ